MICRLFGLALVVLSSTSCGDLADIFEVEGGFVLPQSHANVIRQFQFFSEESATEP